MSYRFYLGRILLPVTPEKLELKIENKNETITLINDGEVNILKRPGLTKVTFGALLPNAEYPFALYSNGFQPAEMYLNQLERWKITRAPFVFRVMRSDGTGISSFDTFLTVSLEEYTITEDAESYGRDVYVSITLLQYKNIATKTITFRDGTYTSGAARTASIQVQRDASSKAEAKTYTVQSGDSLWRIAQLKLGNGSRYPEIYALNQSVIETAAKSHGRSSSSKGAWIYPGTVLSLP